MGKIEISLHQMGGGLEGCCVVVPVFSCLYGEMRLFSQFCSSPPAWEADPCRLWGSGAATAPHGRAGGSGELQDWDGGVGVGSPLEISIAGMMNRINFK